MRIVNEGKTADWQVVGVVSDMKYSSPREQTPPAFYVPCLASWTPEQAARSGMAIAVRGNGVELERNVRREVEGMGRQFVIRSATLHDWTRQHLLRERMLATISSAFGVLTLAVVAMGLYGLMAFAVASRTREIAIRMAIGAQRSDVQWLVSRELLLVLTIGLLLGLGGLAAAATLIRSYLYEVRAFDPLVNAATVLILALTGGAASIVPVRRAISLEPVKTLRHE